MMLGGEDDSGLDRRGPAQRGSDLRADRRTGAACDRGRGSGAWGAATDGTPDGGGPRDSAEHHREGLRRVAAHGTGGEQGRGRDGGGGGSRGGSPRAAGW